MNVKDREFKKRVINGYKSDEWSQKLLSVIRDNKEVSNKKILLCAKNFSLQDGLIFWTGTNESRVFVPGCEGLRTEFITHFHDAAHLGKDKVYNRLSRYAYWPYMFSDVAKYIASCRDCQENKVPNELPGGELKPHEIPDRFWETITTDFRTELPKSERGNNAIVVVVDKISKWAIFVPTQKSVSAPEVAQIFHDWVFSKHGTPVRIISDRDPKFTSNYWKGFTEIINVRLNM